MATPRRLGRPGRRRTASPRRPTLRYVPPGAPVAEAVGPVPRPLRVHHPTIWDGDADLAYAAKRWRAAAGAWRSAARAAGANHDDVWQAVPEPLPGLMRDEELTGWQLGALGLSAVDLPALAAEARQLWPDLFDDE